jgi:hypothetical protein
MLYLLGSSLALWRQNGNIKESLLLRKVTWASLALQARGAYCKNGGQGLLLPKGKMTVQGVS